MDLSPPSLTRSPTPSSHPYCRSERSSIDYSSPILLDQHYKIASVYGSDHCAMSQPMEDHALPSVESIVPSEWSSPTVVHAGPASSGPMPSMMAADYDPFAGYAPHMQQQQAPYPGNQDVYTQHHHRQHQHQHHQHQHHQQQHQHHQQQHQHQHQHQHQQQPQQQRQHEHEHEHHSHDPHQHQIHHPQLDHNTSSPSTDAAASSPHHHASPRHAYVATMESPYHHGHPHHHQSPRSMHQQQPHLHPHATSTPSYVTESAPMYAPVPANPSAYVPEPQFEADAAATVAAAAAAAATTTTFYPGPQAHHTSALQQDARRVYKLAARHNRRPPRRLTTREEANFQCEVKGCGKLFSRSYNYKAHMLTHDEKREYPFPCPIDGCNKKFVRKTDLQRHNQSVHMKERNHKCDYCSRLFARKDTLRRHMDDGCSKRFDIGTVDIREAYEVSAAGPRSFGHPFGHMMSPQTTLPPLTVPATGGLPPLLAPVPQPLRDRGIMAGDHHDNAWIR